MDNFIILPLIKFLQNLPVEISSLILLIICIISILSLFKLFGEQGLYVHSIVAIITANIQILKIIQFDFYSSPVALGTIVFASIYLCSGILTEHYGEQSAKKNVWFCFAAQILISILMLITIGHKPLLFNHDIANNHYILDITKLDIDHIYQVEASIKTLFTPLPRFLFASLISFVVSQRIGIFIFNLIKNWIFKEYIWLSKIMVRTIILLIFSTTIDTFLFNLLAWKLFSPNSLNFIIIFHTYIIPTLITQGIITVLSSPIIYLSYFFKNKKAN